MTIIEYITEEVERQGHDTTQMDGLTRVFGMLEAWIFAIQESGPKRIPSELDILRIGRMIEPMGNFDGYRRVGVRVGQRPCPDPREIPGRMSRLMEVISDTAGPDTALDIYKEFEMIHPFVDGNGRTGKILLNWINGTLWNPIFPPNDLFGHEIRNP